jgi:hypothetical protein
MTPKRRNLAKLAQYLESLPEDYRHFDMSDFASHNGDCSEVVGDAMVALATDPAKFFSNCGTVACALGHGPAAGVRMKLEEAQDHDWDAYCERQFGIPAQRVNATWDFLFSSSWSFIDDTPRGAAARIRYYLDTDEVLPVTRKSIADYAPYLRSPENA